MAKAKKLPSGNWRVQASAQVNGKSKIKSFTAKTAKEAERLADEWQNHIKMVNDDSTSLTVEEAIKEYIRIKSNVLSASTILGYKRYLATGFEDIKTLKLYQLNSVIIQKSINYYSAIMSAKTVKNYYGLLLSTLNLYYPELVLKLTFPKKENKKKREFTKEYLSDLIKAIENKNIEIPALLAMCLSCRASEVAGLKWSDIDFDKHTITVQRSKIKAEEGYVIQNKNKNSTSNRTLFIPDMLYKKLIIAKLKSTSDYIVTMQPNSFWRSLKRATENYGIEPLSFHELRHITASVMVNLGIDTRTAQSIGGWATDSIMKSVYQHAFTESREAANETLNNYFSSL